MVKREDDHAKRKHEANFNYFPQEKPNTQKQNKANQRPKGEDIHTCLGASVPVSRLCVCVCGCVAVCGAWLVTSVTFSCKVSKARKRRRIFQDTSQPTALTSITY